MYRIQIQRASKKKPAPNSKDFKYWATRALTGKIATAELTIRLVDEKEMSALNSTYRHKDKVTNVLSFPFVSPSKEQMDVPLLGDIVICNTIVNQEAEQQGKTYLAHWAHMVVHGALHLLGYDHETEVDANVMEAEEIIRLC
jgi:probable rRNA maturation factor